MKKPVLYLMLGYPGAGKTTVAKLIAKKTGAIDLWADGERQKMFDKPTHSHEENLELYNHLNIRTDELLASGKSVVFDTSFNLRKDRDHLRAIAAKNGAGTLIVWVSTPKSTAKRRSVHAPINRNGYIEEMSDQHFQSIADKLEPPTADEKVIKIDGTKLDTAHLTQILDR